MSQGAAGRTITVHGSATQAGTGGRGGGRGREGEDEGGKENEEMDVVKNVEKKRRK